MQDSSDFKISPLLALVAKVMLLPPLRRLGTKSLRNARNRRNAPEPVC
jgi:hypothetical protein